MTLPLRATEVLPLGGAVVAPSTEGAPTRAPNKILFPTVIKNPPLPSSSPLPSSFLEKKEKNLESGLVGRAPCSGPACEVLVCSGLLQNSLPISSFVRSGAVHGGFLISVDVSGGLLSSKFARGGPFCGGLLICGSFSDGLISSSLVCGSFTRRGIGCTSSRSLCA